MDHHREKPPSAEDIDELAKIRKDTTRIIAFTALALAVLLIFTFTGGSLIIVSTYQRLNNAQEEAAAISRVITGESKSICDFFAVIGLSPVHPSGPQKPQRDVVRLILDSRNTYVARDCVPTLPKPSPELQQLVQGYDLTLLHLR